MVITLLGNEQTLMKLPAKPKILLVPDSYKSSLESHEICRIVSEEFLRTFPLATILAYPMADGGEGSSRIMGEIKRAERVEREVIGPEGNTVRGFFYLNSEGQAFVEFAAASGYALSKIPKRTAPRATSHGTGELIRTAVELGAKEVFLFLGGSATTDGGVGFAKALGYEFLNTKGELMPSARSCLEKNMLFPGEQLPEIGSCRPGPATKMLPGVRIIGVSDVKNPLFGKNGAAEIYGPQKGNAVEEVRELDLGLRNLATIVSQDLGLNYADEAGAGAAGGAGFGVLAFLGGKLLPGANFFLDLIDFDAKLADVDLVITGEGKIDSQSMQGKLLAELLQRLNGTDIPLLSLSGISEVSAVDLANYPNLMAFGLGHVKSLSDASSCLRLLTSQVARLMKSAN